MSNLLVEHLSGPIQSNTSITYCNIYINTSIKQTGRGEKSKLQWQKTGNQPLQRGQTLGQLCDEEKFSEKTKNNFNFIYNLLLRYLEVT